VITNTGTENLYSAVINYNVNSTSAQQVNWSGNLAQYESAQVSIPAFNAVGGENTITATVSNPNGVADENNLNNNTEVSFTTFSGDTFDFQLAILLDDYGSEISWEIKRLGTVIYTGGPYNDDADGELVTVDLCLEEGCYIFTIDDSYGDGLCCEFGEGSWSIYDGQGDVVLYGNGEFGDSETEQFCTDEASVDFIENGSSGLIYPNPADEIMNIEFPKLEGRIFISDITGRTMMDVTFDREPNTTIDVSAWTEGLYIVTWMGKDDEMMTRRITITH